MQTAATKTSPPKDSALTASGAQASPTEPRALVQIAITPNQPLALSPSLNVKTDLPALMPLSASGEAQGKVTEKPGSGTEVGSTAAPNAADGKAAARLRQAKSTYAGRVHRQISQYKGFPSELSRKGIEGTVLTRLTIISSGRLQTVELVKSSGFDVLDRLALDQIRLAAPFPRPPRELRAAPLSFVVPMTYSTKS